MIHVLNFKDEIIDFISQNDEYIIQANHKRNINDRSETFDFTILSKRTEHLKERNRIIIQDSNKQYREFIIEHISSDIDGYTTIESSASYLQDIATAKPLAPMKLEKMTTMQALKEVLKDTGWEASDETEYGGTRTTSWTSYNTKYEVLLQLCTTYSMMLDFYIELDSNTVKHRYVTLKKRNALFKGKEIVYGKDLTGLKRTVDLSSIKTALLCVGPEDDKGQRIVLEVHDDEAQERFGLPKRYIWDVYEPESNDDKMTEARLRTLGTTELNKRKVEIISYEVSSLDIKDSQPHEVIFLGDKVRIKNRDFTPALYVEAEVIGEEYDLIAKESNYLFGQYKEYREEDLRKAFEKRLSDIRTKLNDSISNVNTIVQDTLDTELQHYEKKIIKSDTPPENAVNDVLWLDTSNPNVPILKRYWEGQWIKASVDNAEDIGGITREKALFSELNNTFINLTIQHSKLLNEMHEVMNSEYLVDEDIKASLNSNLDKTVTVFNNIKTNLESMNEDTATIGKLVDTQSLFLKYREQLQSLYKVVEQAKLSIDARIKLLQSQYTDEKFNEALSEVAEKFGLQVSENNELIGEPNVVQKAISVVTEQTDNKLANYVKSQDYQTDKNGIVERLNNSDSERQQLSNQIADRVTLTEYRNMKVGTRNLLLNSKLRSDILSGAVNRYIRYYFSQPLVKGREYTLRFKYKTLKGNTLDKLSIRLWNPDGGFQHLKAPQGILILHTFVAPENSQQLFIYTSEINSENIAYTDIEVSEAMLVEGNRAGDYQEAPEDTDQKLTTMKTEIIQDGKKISQEVSQQIYNASSKTLNQTLSRYINSISTGHQFTYDENGNITNFSVGSSGIKLNARVIDMNDGDVTIKDGVTTIKDAYIDKLFSKQATIEYLKARDIDLNKATVSGSSEGETTVLSGGKIRSTGTFTRTFPEGSATYESYTESWNGTYRSGLISKTSGGKKQTGITRWLSLNDKSVTTQREIHSASPDKNGARFIDFFAEETFGSDVTGQGMHVYSGQALKIESEYGLYLNANKRFYIRTEDSGLEINKDGQNLVLKRTSPYNSTVGSGGSYMSIQSSDGVEQGHVGIISDNRHLSLKSSYGEVLLKGSKVFALDSDGVNRVQMYAQYFSGEKIIGNIEAAESNIYAMCHDELRVVSKAGYNGGNITYKNIRFGSWNAMSHEKFKHDIQEWKYNVLDIYKNDLTLHSYKVNSEADSLYYRIHHGIILRENSNLDQFPVEWRNGDGFDGNEVLWWNTKATQELAFENDELRDNVKTLENNQTTLESKIDSLENILKILEEKLNESTTT